METYFNNLSIILAHLPVVVGFLIFIYLYKKNHTNNLAQKTLRKILMSFALFSVFILTIQIVLQYTVISLDPFLKLFLPPAQEISWFAHTMWSVHISPFVFAIYAGSLIYLFATVANQLFQRELFVENDRYLLFLAALVVKWPNFIIYLSIIAILTILQSLIISLKQSLNTRLIISKILIFAVFITVFFGDMAVRYFELYYLGS